MALPHPIGRRHRRRRVHSAAAALVAVALAVTSAACSSVAEGPAATDEAAASAGATSSSPSASSSAPTVLGGVDALDTSRTDGLRFALGTPRRGHDRGNTSGAFVYRDGRFRPLPGVRGAGQTAHLGINDRGQISGLSIDAGTVAGPNGYPPDAVHGFVRERHGRITSFDIPGGANPLPGDINNRGQVTGSWYDADAVPDPDGVFPPRGSIHGFVRDRRGRVTTFDVPGPRVHNVDGINDRGQVVGRIDLSFTSGRGFLRDPDGRLTWIDVPGAAYTNPAGIDDRGRVVGNYTDAGKPLNPDGSQPPGAVHGFLWDRGRITRFDVPGALLTSPTGMNDRGQIVGGYRDADGDEHGFLLSRGRYTTIDAPGRDGNIAWGINNRGDIVIPEPGIGVVPVAAA